MLNPFPHLLDFVFFSPTILRLFAAGIFAYIAARQWRTRRELAAMTLPVWGTAGSSVALLLSVSHATIALLLFLGLLTQWAAIVGLIATAKHFIFSRRLPAWSPISRTTSALLFAICLSLLITGAGAFAFDIRL